MLVSICVTFNYLNCWLAWLGLARCLIGTSQTNILGWHGSASSTLGLFSLQPTTLFCLPLSPKRGIFLSCVTTISMVQLQSGALDWVPGPSSFFKEAFFIQLQRNYSFEVSIFVQFFTIFYFLILKCPILTAFTSPDNRVCKKQIW